jgi:hypothetical protein
MGVSEKEGKMDRKSRLLNELPYMVYIVVKMKLQNNYPFSHSGVLHNTVI